MDSNTAEQAEWTRQVPEGFFNRVKRKASVIVPSTGEAIHSNIANAGRAWTLRSSRPSTDDGETEPLLGYTNGTDSRPRYYGWISEKLRWLQGHACGNTGKMVLKCALAYWIGSLATFITPVSHFIGRREGKHMVATVTVYFHPARTRGSMFEAYIFAMIALLYSSILSICSMTVSAVFDDWGLIVLAYAIILVVFCAGGLGLIGWVKQAMANPSVNVACSLASIAVITVLTKETDLQLGTFNLERVRQNTITVFMGIMITSIVSFTVWPSSAIPEMKKLFANATDSFSEMLTQITYSFLEGNEDVMNTHSFRKVSADYKLVYSDLPKRLKEAKYERYFNGTESQYELEARLTECMKRLAQQLGGLHSAAITQFSLLKQSGASGMATPNANRFAGRAPALFSPPESNTPFFERSSFFGEPSLLESIDEHEDSDDSAESKASLTPDKAFAKFLTHLGPPMRSLAYTLKLILDDLPFRTDVDSDYFEISINPNFKDSLARALELYSQTRVVALNELHQLPEMKTKRSVSESADVEEVLAACSYFSNCLEDFAEEVDAFLGILSDLKEAQEANTRSWNWLKLWRWKRRLERKGDSANRGVSQILQFPSNTKVVPNVERDQPMPTSYKIWKNLRVFRRPDVKFGIKTGVGAAIYTLFAYIPATRQTFAHWHGEWGLVSYMVVMSMTIGQSSTTSINRFLGTLAGAAMSVIVWQLFSDSPALLSICGWLFSIPCFVIILTWKQSAIGRFILLTYNLTCLYAYSLSIKQLPDEPDDDEGGIDPLILEIAGHRAIAVLFGISWALFINLYIWPLSARKKLREGLSLFWLRLALIWSRDPVDYLIEFSHNKPQLNTQSEQALQLALLKISSYVSQAPHEFRLKGPFPTSTYESLIKANQTILDASHGLTLLLSRHQRDGLSPHLVEVLQVTKRERSDLASRISHLFYVLASGMRLAIPLPDALPRTDSARDRLMAKVGAYKSEKLGGERGEIEKELELVFTYFLVTGKVSEALDECIGHVRRLYGVLEEEMLEF